MSAKILAEHLISEAFVFWGKSRLIAGLEALLEEIDLTQIFSRDIKSYDFNEPSTLNYDTSVTVSLIKQNLMHL